jgi:hypothetical protein
MEPVPPGAARSMGVSTARETHPVERFFGGESIAIARVKSQQTHLWRRKWQYWPM